MAEVNAAQEQNLDPTTNQDVKPEAENKEAGNQNDQPSMQDVQDQLQEALTRIAKLTRAVDKATGEASSYKKKYQETLSAQELASQEKAEKEAQREEEFERLKRNEEVRDLVERYMDMGYSRDAAYKVANAEIDGDKDAKFKLMDQHRQAEKRSWEQEWMKTRPEVNTGSGDGAAVTPEQFNSMGLQERTALLRTNPALYNRLAGRK